MAFVDIGDQFVALAEAGDRHLTTALRPRRRRQGAGARGAREAGADVKGNPDRDPWGNNVEVVAYEDVQFTKAPEILRGMGLEGLDKTEQALEELRTEALG